MKHNVEQCTLIMRQLSPQRGVAETNVSVSSLEELYDYCMNLKEPRLLERVVIAGQDNHGRRHALTFTFQSISEPNKPKAP